MGTALIPIGNATLDGVYYPSMQMHGVKLPKNETVHFFEHNWSFMTKTGITSFLKSLKIPEGYFNRLTAATKIACLAEASADLKTDLMLLVKDTKIQYSSPASLSDEVYATDPLDFLGISKVATGENSRIKMVDCINGRLFLVSTPQIRDVGEYLPSAQISVPIFYNGPFILSSGLYKVRCTNGLLDAVSSSTMKISFSQAEKPGVLAELISSVLNTGTTRARGYLALMDKLRDTPVDAYSLLANLGDPVLKRQYAGMPIAALKKHLSLILSASAVPPNSPSTVRSQYDVMDTLTYYAARNGEDTKKRQVTEEKIFSHFAHFADYKASFCSGKQGAKVAELVE